MPEMNCGNCRFSKFYKKGQLYEEGGCGFCHRYAPKPIMAHSLKYGCEDDLQGCVNTIWPIVYERDFCGEFEAVV